MLWNVLRQGFLDELQKIGAVSTAGLSPETLLSQQPPPPMETLGSKKAIELLDMAQSMKMASVSTPGMQLRSSQKTGQPVLSRAKKGPGIKQQIRGGLIGLKGALPPT
jgi:hypothetical protein